MIQLAQGASKFEEGITNITHNLVKAFIDPLILIITGLALIMFFYGLMNFVLKTESSEKEDGKKHMIFGLIGLLIIFAVWGIISFVGDTVNSLR